MADAWGRTVNLLKELMRFTGQGGQALSKLSHTLSVTKPPAFGEDIELDEAARLVKKIARSLIEDSTRQLDEMELQMRDLDLENQLGQCEVGAEKLIRQARIGSAQRWRQWKEERCQGEVRFAHT